MFLSRSGLEINEIWHRQSQLIESDRRLRDLERRTQADPEDRGAHDALQRERLRAGRHDEWMKPEVDLYNKTQENRKKVMNDSRHHFGKDTRAKIDNARAAVQHQRQRIDDMARSIGRHAGEFIHSEPGEHHFAHMERVAQAHRRGGYSWDQETMGTKEKVHFFERKHDRDAFAHAIKKHYGDQYDVESRDAKTHGFHMNDGDEDYGEHYRVHIRRHDKSPEFNARHVKPHGGKKN